MDESETGHSYLCNSLRHILYLSGLANAKVQHIFAALIII